MNKDVQITVTGIHGTGEDRDTVVTKCDGFYFEKNGKVFLKYSETDADTGEVRHSTVVIENPHTVGLRISVEHRGNTDARMIFETGKKNLSDYVSPMGGMVLEIDTVSLSYEQTDTKIKIRASYKMSLGGSEPTSSEIMIDVVNK